MTGGLPQDVGKLAMARANANKSSTSVKVDRAGAILSSGTKGDNIPKGDTITINARETGNRKLSKRALALKACKGKKGCEFAECLEKAFGKVPAKWLEKCPTIGKNENITE